MPITTGSFAKLLWPGINTIYGREYPKYPEQWRDLFEIELSDKHYEEDVGISSFGLVPVKDEGGSITYDTEFQGFTTRYVHTTYGMGFVVTREMYEDNMYNEVSFRNAKNLAFSVATTLNTLGAAVYNNATSYTGGDGVSLLNNTHVRASGDATAVDNLSSSTLSEAALEDAQIAISKFTNDRGLRIAAKPMSLIIPPDLAFTAHRILQSPLRFDTANNDANALRDMGTIPKVIVNNYITGTTSWYLRTNIPNGMKMFQRRAPEFNTDNDFDTENAKFKVTFRCSWGWTDWMGLYGYDT